MNLYQTVAEEKNKKKVLCAGERECWALESLRVAMAVAFVLVVVLEFRWWWWDDEDPWRVGSDT